MIVFDIKRYAINDGPGIRTTVFLKGCPLRCVWCHNPESWLPHPEVLFKQSKCIGCNCCGIHPHQIEKMREERLEIRDERGKMKDSQAQPSPISQLSSRISSCPTLALETCGREYTVDELLAEIEKERDIMLDSGGGVTISGGEPLLQIRTEARPKPLSISPRGGESSLSHEMTTSGNATLPPTGGDGEGLLPLLHELGLRGIHRAIDTTLYASPDVVRAVASEADLFLVDLKMMDAGKHKRYTGVSNELILSNLRLLASLGAPIQIRIPLIEGINADEENIEATALFLKQMREERLEMKDCQAQPTLNPQPSTLNPQPSTLISQPSSLNPQPSTLNPHLRLSPALPRDGPRQAHSARHNLQPTGHPHVHAHRHHPATLHRTVWHPRHPRCHWWINSPHTQAFRATS